MSTVTRESIKSRSERRSNLSGQANTTRYLNGLQRAIIAKKLSAHTPKKSNFPLKPITSSRFNELVQIDHMKLSPTSTGYNHVLVMVDHYTKLAEAVPCGDDNAEQTCDLLPKKWFARYGTPAYIQSDNGPQFAARLTQLFVQAGYIIQVFSTPEHPRTNGLVERQNRTLLTC